MNLMVSASIVPGTFAVNAGQAAAKGDSFIFGNEETDKLLARRNGAEIRECKKLGDYFSPSQCPQHFPLSFVGSL
jgi:hypothetical protein